MSMCSPVWLLQGTSSAASTDAQTSTVAITCKASVSTVSRGYENALKTSTFLRTHSRTRSGSRFGIEEERCRRFQGDAEGCDGEGGDAAVLSALGIPRSSAT